MVSGFPSPKSVARIWPRILPPPRFCPSWVSASHPLPGPPGVQLWYTFGSPFWGHLSPLKGPHPFWTPKREGGGTSDPFGVTVALLSAAAECFRAWVSVEILWRRVLLPLLAVAGRCNRAQPLINIEGATKHKHGMTCAAKLFYLRLVRSCAASAF